MLAVEFRSKRVMPGLEAVRKTFLMRLDQRHQSIAEHALVALHASEPKNRDFHLQEAANVLHQVGGTAATLGFPNLGACAQTCESQIIEFLNPDEADHQWRLEEIVAALDKFSKLSLDLLGHRRAV